MREKISFFYLDLFVARQIIMLKEAKKQCDYFIPGSQLDLLHERLYTNPISTSTIESIILKQKN